MSVTRHSSQLTDNTFTLIKIKRAFGACSWNRGFCGTLPETVTENEVHDVHGDLGQKPEWRKNLIYVHWETSNCICNHFYLYRDSSLLKQLTIGSICPWKYILQMKIIWSCLNCYSMTNYDDAKEDGFKCLLCSSPPLSFAFLILRLLDRLEL